jgi:hypothetical protein
VGETLAETRLEIEAHRSDMEATARELEARIRHALDIKARFRENPVLFIGVGAGVIFLVSGGPVRIAQALRRRLRPTNVEQAYDALPSPMQAWVDTLVEGVGPKADKTRLALIEELQHWRREPMKSKKARRELARAMVEGPPGPRRAAWKAGEAALTLLAAAMARRAVEALLTGERPITIRRATVPAGPPEPEKAAEEYSGFSSRTR